MAIFLADMPPLPPRPPKQHAQISWLAKGGRFYLFSLSRRSRDETSFGSCSGGEDVAPLALLASLGLTTTLVHEKKHEGQHRGKNDRRASQDIKVVRGHEKPRHFTRTASESRRPFSWPLPHILHCNVLSRNVSLQWIDAEVVVPLRVRGQMERQWVQALSHHPEG